MARLNSYRLYGSIRILRDGRVHFSPWTFTVLSYLSFMVMNDDLISVEVHGRPVLDLDLSRGRVRSANFWYNLTPDELRGTVSDLRQAGHGIERWIVPALEFTSLASAFREENPAAYAIVPELLASCGGLPVATHWKRVRANVIARYEKARAERTTKKTVPGKPVEDGTQAGKPRKAPTSKAQAKRGTGRRLSGSIK